MNNKLSTKCSAFHREPSPGLEAVMPTSETFPFSHPSPLFNIHRRAFLVGQISTYQRLVIEPDQLTDTKSIYCEAPETRRFMWDCIWHNCNAIGFTVTAWTACTATLLKNMRPCRAQCLNLRCSKACTRSTLALNWANEKQKTSETLEREPNHVARTIHQRSFWSIADSLLPHTLVHQPAGLQFCAGLTCHSAAASHALLPGQLSKPKYNCYSFCKEWTGGASYQNTSHCFRKGSGKWFDDELTALRKLACQIIS